VLYLSDSGFGQMLKSFIMNIQESLYINSQETWYFLQKNIRLWTYTATWKKVFQNISLLIFHSAFIIATNILQS
jgi:hypothetical protein